MQGKRWTWQTTPLTTKTIVITGANNGIGFEATTALAQKGAHVVMAVRSVERGEKARQVILETNPQAKLTVMKLDLSDLERVRAFAQQLTSQIERIDVLLNNAGVMIPPFQKTQQGWELQVGCNHFGHFALTGLLLPRLLQNPEARIVTVSSIASKRGKIDLDHLTGDEGYNAYRFYCQSKRMNYLFGVSLDHQLKAHGSTVKSIVCHPGIASTNLMSRGSGKPTKGLLRALMGWIGHDATHGAFPLLEAVTNPSLQGGEMIGPDGSGGRRGDPFIDRSFTALWDETTASKLWAYSEQATSVSYVWR
jgi:NAD(P)-dependent dehydrogenase (short-subunit alcohol dehydrogenase family)